MRVSRRRSSCRDMTVANRLGMICRGQTKTTFLCTVHGSRSHLRGFSVLPCPLPVSSAWTSLQPHRIAAFFFARRASSKAGVTRPPARPRELPGEPGLGPANVRGLAVKATTGQYYVSASPAFASGFFACLAFSSLATLTPSHLRP